MSYSLDTPYSSQVVFMNSENSVFKQIDGQGELYLFIQHADPVAD
jgi:hypothetical protein